MRVLRKPHQIFELWKREIWTDIRPFPNGRLPIVGRWPLTSGVHPIMAVGHLFQTYLPDNKSLTQFLGQRVQAGRETDLWNGAIWGQRHLHSACTRSCSAHIYRCPSASLLCNGPGFLIQEKENTVLCCQGPVACRMRWLQTVVGRFMWHGQLGPGGHLHIASILLCQCPTSDTAVINLAGHNIFFPMQASLRLAFRSSSCVLSTKQRKINVNMNWTFLV